MKMYILVKDSVPLGYAMVAVAHASLIGYLHFEYTEEIDNWIQYSFKKVICKVSETEFEKAKQVEHNFVVTESTLNNEEVAIVFKPREEYPKMFKFLKLYN